MDPNNIDNTQPQEKFSLLNFIKKKKIIFGVLGVTLLIVISSTVLFLLNRDSKYNEVEVIIEEARQAYSQGDLQLVRSKLEQAYNDYPDDPGIQAAIIKTIANQGNLAGTETNSYDEAQIYVKDALNDNSDTTEILIAVGYLEETAGNYQRALELYFEALKIEETNSITWFHAGHALHFLGRYEEAKQAYEASYELDNNNPLALIAMGNIATNENRLDDAYNYFIETSKLTNTSTHIRAEALTAASIVRRMQILYMEEAINLAKQAVDLSPGFSPALAAYGYALSINGNPADGFEYLKKSIEANPRISQNYSLGAQVLRNAQMYEDAISYQTQAIEKVDNDNTILGSEAKNETKAYYIYDLAKTYSLSGGRPDTVSLLQQAIELNPALRDVLLSDYREYNFFRELSQDTDFQAFL